jgi:hypothetical protein
MHRSMHRFRLCGPMAGSHSATLRPLQLSSRLAMQRDGSGGAGWAWPGLGAACRSAVSSGVGVIVIYCFRVPCPFLDAELRWRGTVPGIGY